MVSAFERPITILDKITCTIVNVEHVWFGILLCNIFELVFTLCHKCDKYNCLPWKILNHAGNSYITRRKQLCHPPDTVMSHRIQLYHPLVYFFCILIRSGSRSNVAVAKQSKQRCGIIKRNKRIYEQCISFYLTSFLFKNVT